MEQDNLEGTAEVPHGQGHDYSFILQKRDIFFFPVLIQELPSITQRCWTLRLMPVLNRIFGVSLVIGMNIFCSIRRVICKLVIRRMDCSNHWYCSLVNFG
mgnify:CR=1 FL=1